MAHTMVVQQLVVVLLVVYFDQRHVFAPGPETLMPRCLAGKRGKGYKAGKADNRTREIQMHPIIC